MTPREWLLLLFDGAPKPLDRVRIQKAMFLFAMRSNACADQKYDFQPYNYGPFSFEIYPDLASLVSEGRLETEEAKWMSSPLYTLSPQGEAAVAELRAQAPPKRLALLHGLRGWVLERDFATLLRDVYAEYPDYATKSVFRYERQ